jgi:diguanylate cyclase (GGDEF)-like protein
LSLTTYFTIQQQADFTKTALLQKGSTLGKTISLMSAEPFFLGDFVTLNDNMRLINQVPGVVFCVVLNTDSQPVTNYLNKDNSFVKEAIRLLSPDETLKIVNYLKKNSDVLAVRAPVVYEGKTLGTIHLGLSRDKHSPASQTSPIKHLIVNTAIILVTMICLYIVVRRFIEKPIQLLHQGTKRVGLEQFAENVSWHERDELGVLASAFNEMMDQLKERFTKRDSNLKKLRDSNAQLQEQLAEQNRRLEVAKKEVEHYALYDSLTGFPNRVLLQDRLQQGLHLAYRQNSPLALIVVDLDRFKEVNDTLGHKIGDRLLCEFSRRIMHVLRKTDTVARLGGDEFAVLLPSSNFENTVMIARKMLEILRDPFKVDGHCLYIGASLGIALHPEHGHDTSSLLQHAEVAMYAAKRSSAGYALYDPNEDENSPSRLVMLSELRNAIDMNGLMLYFQPQVDVKTGSTYGLEALLRWNHKEKGIISAKDIIPLAEHSGLIKPLTKWVLDKALRSCSRWLSEGVLSSVAVNISFHNLKDQQFPQQVQNALQKWKVKPENLVLEVSESAFMEDPMLGLRSISALHKIGVRVSIDDFGTGYSSFASLKRIPVDEVKIDGCIIHDLAISEESTTIVSSMIDLAHNLKLRVVAESVESEQVWRALEDLECDGAQGYYLTAPVSLEDIDRWLSITKQQFPGRKQKHSVG